MSDGDPSLEEDVPKPLLEKVEDNVFTPKITTPIFAGGVKLHHKRSDAGETESFLSDAQRNELAFQQLFQDGVEEFQRTEAGSEEKMADLQAMSVLSMYQDNMSRDMNTDRDNGSDASTRPAEECVWARGQDAIGKASANQCSIVMGGILNNPSLTFNDGVRTIDYVLVWESAKEDASKPEAVEQRRVFEDNLMAEGLQLEIESPENLYGLNFVKIHAPLAVLKDYGEILKLRMPMKDCSKIRKSGRTNAILTAAMYMSKFSTLKDVQDKTSSLMDRVESCWHRVMARVRVDPDKFPERKHRLTAIYSKDKEYLFDTSAECFWTPSIRSRIVQFILDRKKFSTASGDDFAFGITRMINNGVYSAAYPLHDGDLKTPGSLRHLLYTEWASVSKCLNYQPLDYVKDYFGVKIGLYFAWLGFYTHMLIPAAIVGLICFIYSAATIFSNKPSEDVCTYNSTVKMCPLCDYFCDYWDLKDTCLQSRVTYLFDNPTTVFFAIFMSFWAACFLELWKRYSAEMTHRWDLTGFDMYEEHPRPQYLARLTHVKRTQVNFVTGEREPMVPFWRMRLPATLMSFSVVALLVLMAVAAVLGVVLYRMSLLGAAILRQDTNALITYNPIMFTTATAACINLLLICVFNYIFVNFKKKCGNNSSFIYLPMSISKLTELRGRNTPSGGGLARPTIPFWGMRLPATLMSFSVVALLVLMAVAAVLGVVLYRMSLLGAAILRQDTNALITYNPIMFTTATAACINLLLICVFNYIYQYLAEWLTEKELLRTQTEFDDSLTLKIYLLQFVNYYASIFYIAFFKGKYVGRPGDYVRIFGHRQEECAPGGCLLELSIQLAIIMVGKQFINTIVEMMMPYLLKWWNIIRAIGRKKTIKSPMQWVKDFKLVDFGNMGLFPEYLEMVLQYGFVTIFVAAFPLAPLFALINNVLEMRLDAKKFLTCYRRPVPQRVTDIGVWYRILDSIGKLSVITNGFIIAFTSEFIPRLVYQFSFGSLDSYVNHTLADFNVTVFDKYKPIKTQYTETMCSYPGYWYYQEGDNYERSNWYWHIIGARLAFVVVFENVVALVMIIVRWAIPDMSGELRDRIRREAYVINSFILEETRTRSLASRRAPHSPLTPPGDSCAPTWNQVASLSGSDFDLAAHGEPQTLRDITRHVVDHERRSDHPEPAHV